MRVDAAKQAAYGAATRTRRAGAAGFAPVDTGAPAVVTSPTAPRSIADIGVLVALQGFDEVGERRKRAIKRGTATLDALEELKLGLLAGTLDAGALARLRAAATGEASGDARLDAILAEVDLRAAVELAKIGSQTGQADGR